jgi:hypothetical protein
MTISIKNILANLIVVLAIISVNQWSVLPIGNTYTNWIIYFIISILFLSGMKYYYDSGNSKNLLFVKLYLFWVIICCFRGIFVAENYWDFKSLIQSSLALLLIVSIFIFTNASVIKKVLSKWLFYSLPLFFVLIIVIDTQSYGYYLIPVSFFALFFPFLSRHWKIIISIISLFVIFIDLDARSNVIKFLVPILFSFLFYFKSLVNFKFIKLLYMTCFALPFIFLFLGVTNVFNVFHMDEYIKGTYTEKKIIAGQIKENDLKADTRSFLYKEVFLSALKNKYILIGRTPARGNESEYFGSHSFEELKTGRYERYGNEVSILNIFTWTGVIGVLLYFMVFLKSVYLAIYKSNNFFMKVIGLYVMFRWIYAWVEDFNRFDIMNIVLWMLIAMCYSEQFRNKSDSEFKFWFNSIFKEQPYFKSSK